MILSTAELFAYGYANSCHYLFNFPVRSQICRGEMFEAIMREKIDPVCNIRDHRLDTLSEISQIVYWSDDRIALDYKTT